MNGLTISEVHALNSGKADAALKDKAKKLAEAAVKKPVAKAGEDGKKGAAKK